MDTYIEKRGRQLWEAEGYEQGGEACIGTVFREKVCTGF